jgi:hypothetical protein
LIENWKAGNGWRRGFRHTFIRESSQCTDGKQIRKTMGVAKKHHGLTSVSRQKKAGHAARINYLEGLGSANETG